MCTKPCRAELLKNLHVVLETEGGERVGVTVRHLSKRLVSVCRFCAGGINPAYVNCTWDKWVTFPPRNGISNGAYLPTPCGLLEQLQPTLEWHHTWACPPRGMMDGRTYSSPPSRPNPLAALSIIWVSDATFCWPCSQQRLARDRNGFGFLSKIFPMKLHPRQEISNMFFSMADHHHLYLIREPSCPPKQLNTQRLQSVFMLALCHASSVAKSSILMRPLTSPPERSLEITTSDMVFCTCSNTFNIEGVPWKQNAESLRGRGVCKCSSATHRIFGSEDTIRRCHSLLYLEIMFELMLTWTY